MASLSQQLAAASIANRIMRLGVPMADFLTMLAHENVELGDNYLNEAAVVNLLASATDQVVVTYRVPQGMLGILKHFATAAENPTDMDNIRWRLRINRSPVVGFDDMIGVISTLVFPLRVNLQLFKNALVEIVASNLTAVQINNVTAMIRGTIFPPEAFAPELLASMGITRR